MIWKSVKRSIKGGVVTNNQITSHNKELILLIEKELERCSRGNKRDVIYLITQEILFAKDPKVKAQAWRQLTD
jgi:hypothetical protein